MALPVAHTAVALGLTRSRDPLAWAFLGFLSILPDFDFLLVWGLGLPIGVYHRTFSHSALFCVAISLLWMVVRPARLKAISPLLVVMILLSHSFLDMLCTSDVLGHGVVFFWPLSNYRMGWPTLVPLYLFFGSSPFSFSGAIWFTLLEMFLAGPLWLSARSLRIGLLLCTQLLGSTEIGPASKEQ